ncbi:MAG: NAD(P)-binding domain-containing protein [Bacteroidota bacterium]
MTVGILGSGAVGKALGRGFASRGHTVLASSRVPDAPKHRQWEAECEGDVAVVSFAKAAEAGDLLVLATAWEGTEDTIRAAGPEHFAGKVILDATNPLDFSDGTPRLAVSEASGTLVQRWLPGAHVVKAFNTVGAGLMVNPNLLGGPPSMFLAGDSAEAKATAAEIARDFGWETFDLGGIDRSAHLDHLAVIWILNAMAHGRERAFKVLSG